MHPDLYSVYYFFQSKGGCKTSVMEDIVYWIAYHPLSRLYFCGRTQQVPKVHYDMCACVAIHWDNEITPSTNLTNRSNPSLVVRLYLLALCLLANSLAAPLQTATARDTMQVVENGFGTRVMYEEKGERRAFLWSTEWSSLNYLDRCFQVLLASLIFTVCTISTIYLAFSRPFTNRIFLHT